MTKKLFYKATINERIQLKSLKVLFLFTFIGIFCTYKSQTTLSHDIAHVFYIGSEIIILGKCK